VLTTSDLVKKYVKEILKLDGLRIIVELVNEGLSNTEALLQIKDKIHVSKSKGKKEKKERKDSHVMSTLTFDLN
jgi:hypothetical protein